MKIANINMPKIDPRKEEVVAKPIAYPALPCLANGLPSTVVAALAGVPGILIKIAVRLPPKIAPIYIHIKIKIAWLLANL